MTAMCPQCAKAIIDEYRPFCSKRCQLVDLGRWLKGDYAIAVDNGENDQVDTMNSTDDDHR